MSSKPVQPALTPESDLALDLLIARAALDDELRAAILAAPEQTCLANGIKLPEGLQVIFTHPEKTVIIREIPTSLPSPSLEKAAVPSTQVLQSVGLNGISVEVAADVAVAEAVAEATTEVTTAEVAAEAVVVAT